MVGTLAYDKGRAENLRLNFLLRRIAAHALAASLRIRVRWVSIEEKLSDTGLRHYKVSQTPISFPYRHVCFHGPRATRCDDASTADQAKSGGAEKASTASADTAIAPAVFFHPRLAQSAAPR